MQIEKIVENLNKNLKENYKGATGIILGTSFSNFIDKVDIEKEIFFRDIGGLNCLGSDREENKIIFGKISDKKIILMLGRLHYNFGYSTEDIANVIFLLKELGCERLILTSSVGAISKKLKVGDIVTFYDQINLTGRNPLYSLKENKYGNTFIDMINPYDQQLIDILTITAKKEMSIKVKNCLFAEFPGPCAETVSESKVSQLMGADVVGFNICNEVIACKYCSLPVVVFSLVTNYASAFTSNKIKHEDIVYNRKCAGTYYLELLSRFIKNLN